MTAEIAQYPNIGKAQQSVINCNSSAIKLSGALVCKHIVVNNVDYSIGKLLHLKITLQRWQQVISSYVLQKDNHKLNEL